MKQALPWVIAAALTIGLAWMLMRPLPPDNTARYLKLQQDSIDYATSFHTYHLQRQQDSLVIVDYEQKDSALSSLLSQADAIRAARPHKPHSVDADTVTDRIYRAIGDIQHLHGQPHTGQP